MPPQKPELYRITTIVTKLPADSEDINVEIPEGAKFSSHIVEKVDLRVEDDWENFFYQISSEFFRMMRGGWPVDKSKEKE